MFTTATGAAAFTPDDYAALIVQPVQGQSVALQVATTLTTDSTRMHIPVIVDDGGAAWLSEGAEIPIEDAELGEEIVTPAKVAGLRVISSEMAEDSSPAAQKVVGDALARAISLQLDSAFFGNLASPAPKGLSGEAHGVTRNG
ncbi:phage major capsid protein [Streptomyces sp. ISL-100]|uniref:phage major capsid protein n=1 Tax=Streptomyces sp. ISL-100 TaxID=2819173 RepID=UPI001BE9D8EB|nr:phage major capsid protein [Streptomyces sp. ISL-100]MBT2397947.1 phage major capsid protein [Streptomyces sp. ISL-100]